MLELTTMEDIMEASSEIGQMTGSVDFLGGVLIENAKSPCEKAALKAIKFIDIQEAKEAAKNK